MPFLWVRENPDNWAVLPLESHAYGVDSNPPRALGDPLDDADVREGVVLLRAEHGEPEVWVILSADSTRTRINGLPVTLGLRVLDDRDEIRIEGAGTVFFSDERLARIEPFPGGDSPIYCARCKQELSNGAHAVRCPRCGVWHHQTDDLPCWTYAETCALCDQPTDLASGFRWTPEEI